MLCLIVLSHEGAILQKEEQNTGSSNIAACRHVHANKERSRPDVTSGTPLPVAILVAAL
jgi:hypothetical protein